MSISQSHRFQWLICRFKLYRCLSQLVIYVGIATWVLLLHILKIKMCLKCTICLVKIYICFLTYYFPSGYNDRILIAESLLSGGGIRSVRERRGWALLSKKNGEPGSCRVLLLGQRKYQGEENTGGNNETNPLFLLPSNLHFLYLAALFLDGYHKLWDAFLSEK